MPEEEESARWLPDRAHTVGRVEDGQTSKMTGRQKGDTQKNLKLGKPRDFSERTTGSRVTLVDEEGGAWGCAMSRGGGGYSPHWRWGREGHALGWEGKGLAMSLHRKGAVEREAT